MCLQYAQTHVSMFFKYFHVVMVTIRWNHNVTIIKILMQNVSHCFMQVHSLTRNHFTHSSLDLPLGATHGLMWHLKRPATYA